MLKDCSNRRLALMGKSGNVFITSLLQSANTESPVSITSFFVKGSNKRTHVRIVISSIQAARKIRIMFSNWAKQEDNNLQIVLKIQYILSSI